RCSVSHAWGPPGFGFFAPASIDYHPSRYDGERRPMAQRDVELKAIEWKDLLGLRDREIAHELMLSLPWLAASWAAAVYRCYPWALLASFMFFLTGLRQVHNAYHYALGISRAATEWLMFVLSALMLGSMHAVQVTHLRHHRYCMAEDDVEAASARLRGWQAVL